MIPPKTPKIVDVNNKTINNNSNYNPLYYHNIFHPYCVLSVFYTITAHILLKITGQLKGIERQLPSPPILPPLPEDNNQQKIAIVTGSNTGIGYETAKCLVHDYGYIVIIACRSRDKGIAAVNSINKELTTTTKGKAIFVHPLDLSSIYSVKQFCTSIKEQYTKLHLLVNNAGTNYVSTQYSDIDNYDLIYQTNFLSHFILTCELLSLLQVQSSKSTSTSSAGRIINLGSVMHHFTKLQLTGSGSSNKYFESITFWKSVALGRRQLETKSSISSNTETETELMPLPNTSISYNFSKLAAILFSIELTKRYKHTNVISISVNPGGVSSDIWRNFPTILKDIIFPMVYLTSQQGCRTTIAAATLPENELFTNDDNYNNNTNNTFNNLCCYIQPYWIPTIPLHEKCKTPEPMFEMLGPYQGYRITQPRLPTNALTCSDSLWNACTELTGCVWPSSSSS